VKSSCDGCEVGTRLVELGEVREVFEVDSIAKTGGGSMRHTCEDRG
jgi:hypothetical protein